MRATPLLVSLLLVSLSAAALAPTASAVGNCPNGWNGVLVTQPSGNKFGFCCSPWWPMECYAYPLDRIEPLP